MIFYVFSFNRGEFLRNCIESIEQCAPGSEIIIHDDESDDPQTRAVLEQIAKKHAVVTAGANSGHKHGGLYANMQAALESAPAGELICFLQDDVQMVRNLDARDIRHLDACFHRDPALGFICPAFIRGISVTKEGTDSFDYDSEKELFYWQDNRRSAGSYYSDIFVSKPERLRESGWHFRSGEPANQRQARERFGRMGYMRCPFLMWLPYGPAYRGKQKTLALKIAERTRSCGFYPFRYLSDTQKAHLRENSPPELPVAENFLTPVQNGLSKPWIYNPLQGSRLLKHMNRVETFLRSLLPS